MADNVRTDMAKLMSHAQLMFRTSAELTRDQARANLGGSGPLTNSVRVEYEGPFEARVGTDHPGGKAQEGGAYITPKNGRALKFADGGFRPRARIRAKRWLSRAGGQFQGAVLTAATRHRPR